MNNPGLRIKGLLPVLREKKRYVVYRAVVRSSQFSAEKLALAIRSAFLQLFGEIGLSEAGLIFLKDKFNKSTHSGIVKVRHTHVAHLRFALALVRQIDATNVIVRSVGVSGILKKAEQKQQNLG